MIGVHKTRLPCMFFVDPCAYGVIHSFPLDISYIFFFPLDASLAVFINSLWFQQYPSRHYKINENGRSLKYILEK